MPQAIVNLFGAPPSALVGAVMKYGPAWALLAYLVYTMSSGMGAAITAGNANNLADHRELGFYLRQICLGVNRDSPSGWQQCQPPREK